MDQELPSGPHDAYTGATTAPEDREPGRLELPELFQALLDANPSAVALLDAEGRTRIVNLAWRELARSNGYDGDGISELYSELCGCALGMGADASGERGIRKVIAGECAEFQLEYAVDGAHRQRWYLLRARRLVLADSTWAIVEHYDITAQKQVEATLRQSEASYRTLIEHLPVVTYTAALDEASTSLYVNPQIEALLGFSPEEWLADSSLWLRQIHPEDRPRALASLQRCLATGEPESLEFRMLTRDGRVVWVNDVAVVVRDEEGWPLFLLGITQDVTAHKQIEEALREREMRLQVVAEQLPAVVWSVDRELRFTSRNGRGLNALHVQPDEAIGRSVMDYQQSLDPSGIAAAAHRQALRGEPVSYELETAGRTFQAHVEPWRDTSGAIAGAVGVALDVTDSRQLRTAFAENQRRLQALFDNAEDGFLLVDDQAHFVDANPAALKLIGYTRDELLKLGIGDITPPPGRASVLDAWRAFVGEGRRTGDFVLLRRDGGMVEVEFRAIGNIVPGLHLSILRDITERKRVEAERARQAEALARLAEDERTRQTELARSNSLITALSHVAARIESTRDADHVMATLGKELRPLGITCMVTLLDPGDGALVVAYSSIEAPAQAAIETITGRGMLEFRLPRETLPGYAELIENRRALAVGRPKELIASLLPELPEHQIAEIVRLANADAGSQALYLPLIVEDVVQGVLWLWGNGLHENDIPAITVFAGQVASALDRARLFARLRELSRQLVDAQEAERRALARELHDQIGQNLAVLNINLVTMRAQLSPESAARIDEHLADTHKLIDETLERIRNVLTELRPTILDDYGLAAVLEWYVPHTARRLGLSARVLADERAPRLPPNVEVALFRVTQEALTNVAKHARAHEVSVTLDMKRDVTRLIIADDGVGFDTARPQPIDRRWGMGLTGMRERVEALGGRMWIDSTPGLGTRVIVEVTRTSDAN